MYWVEPGQRPQVYARGFTNIIDIAFDGRGRLYVLEIAHNSLLAEEPYGALQRVNKNGSKNMLLDEGLIFPGGLPVRSAHEVYVTNCPASGWSASMLARRCRKWEYVPRGCRLVVDGRWWSVTASKIRP